MAATYKSIIEREIDRLFDDPDAAQMNPINGAINWAREPIEPQKKAAVVPLLAREWFAVYGPPDAPQLPLSSVVVEAYRNASGMKAIVGFYARSLCREGYGRRCYDFCNHPSFDDFARGLMAMAMERGLRGLEKDGNLKQRFPPRPLAGMTPAAYWAPPREYEVNMARRAGLPA